MTKNPRAPSLLIAKLGYGSWLLLPIVVLFLMPSEEVVVDKNLMSEAIWNTAFMVFCVLSMTALLGTGFAAIYSFFNYPLRGLFHKLLMIPLAFPAYVLAFIYLSGETHLSSLQQFFGFEMQGQLWFLIFILSLSLTPYVYFFCCLGFQQICQNEVETELILQGGMGRFLTHCIGPHILPFLMSGLVLVFFESLADFGAASMVNVPVMTTIIYKIWFDLFSFSGAVHIATRFAFVIFIFLVLEKVFKRNTTFRATKRIRDLRRRSLKSYQFLTVMGLYTLVLVVSVILPSIQMIKWSLLSFEPLHFLSTLKSLGATLFLALFSAALAVLSGVLLSLWVRKHKDSFHYWIGFSTFGYSLPGSILAVSCYALLMFFFAQMTFWLSLFALILALTYKFFTLALRSIGENVASWPKELDEMSDLLDVSSWRRWSCYYYPFMNKTMFIAFLMICIEVMKEMPLTLMLAPSGFQTLSIQIFNFTSEGEWEKASLPGLMLILMGFVSVFFLQKKGEVG